jgi:hypothetical protein
MLRIADALDRTHATLVRGVRCTIRPRTIELRLEVDADPELELWAARRKSDLLEALTERSLRFAVEATRDSDAPRPSPAHTQDDDQPRAAPAALAPDRKRKRLRLVG